MSYLNYPRIHFSGTYQASPSTINNTPNNWDPLFYPAPNQLDRVELYWNPKGDGGFYLNNDCVVTKIEYAPGDVATTPEEDSIIGQPVKAIKKSSFPLQSALVDLDPDQQNVSEIWAMTLQIGGSSGNLTGTVPNVAFSGIWQQCQGPNFPKSSTSGSAAFQVKMNKVVLGGSSNGSRFLDLYTQNPTGFLSLNLNTNGHNNKPPLYDFTPSAFQTMKAPTDKSLKPVKPEVLHKLIPMQSFFQNSKEVTLDDGKKIARPEDPGYIPTEIFVKYMLQQFLTTQEFNDNIDTILAVSKPSNYTNSGPYDFLIGMITGTAGVSSSDDPNYFVSSRILNPQTSFVPNSPMSLPPKSVGAWYTPFTIEDNTITVNFGNSLPTNTPGNDVYVDKLGTPWLVAFPNGIALDQAVDIVEIPIKGSDFIAQSAGFFTANLNDDYSNTPLGVVCKNLSDGSPDYILLAEDENGYYLRADQFVYRMNPGHPTTSDFPRGNTNTIQVHATKFGNPVPDGTNISLTLKTEQEAIDYTSQTMGTGGTKGIKNLSIPQNVISHPTSAQTVNGVATFDISCTAPGNPRHYIDGQIYFLDYDFENITIQKDSDDLISVMVYDAEVLEDAPTLLGKFGRLYKIMGFLADETTIEQIDMRNMIKTLLSKPMHDLVHMPVTRDLSAAARDKVVAWVDALNNS